MEPDASDTFRWSTPAGLVALGWALTAGSALWWLTATSAMDRLFVGVVLLVMLAVSCYATFVRPRLRADADGVAVRSLTGTRRWSWPDVRIRVRTHQRLGRTVETLELDAPDGHGATKLVVLGKLDLGQEVTEVADRLEQLRLDR